MIEIYLEELKSGCPITIFATIIQCILILILICLIYTSIYEDLYKPHIKYPICKYIKERRDRLMIKTSPLRLRGNNKNKYLKL